MKKIETMFGKDGSKLPQMPPKKFAEAFNKLNEAMKTQLARAAGQGLLKEYSPWLSSFQPTNYGDRIEIPGKHGCRKYGNFLCFFFFFFSFFPSNIINTRNKLSNILYYYLLTLIM